MPWFKTFFAAILSAPFFFFAPFGGTHFTPPAQPTGSSSQPVACTMEAKICPDGSSVGRMPPRCDFAACPTATSTHSHPTPTAPTVSTITPQEGSIGTRVTISGNGFTNDNIIHFGSGTIVHVAAKNVIYHCPMIAAGSSNTACGGAAQTLTFTVPAALNPVCFYSTPRCMVASLRTTPGAYKVSVSNANGTSNTIQFTVIDSSSGSGSTNSQTPVVYSITPTEGAIGTTVTIDGYGFTNDNTIHFGDGAITHATSTEGPAIMCPNNATNCHSGIQQRITFSVPSEIAPYCAPGQMCLMYIREVTPGAYGISIQNDNGTSNAIQFTVTDATSTQMPDIYSITPQTGPVGTTVTINGDGFTNDNIIHFGSGAIAHVVAKPAVFSCPMMPAGDTKPCGPFSQTLTFTIPSSVGPYCPVGQMCPMYRQEITAGSYSLFVQNDNGTSDTAQFQVTN